MQKKRSKWLFYGLFIVPGVVLYACQSTPFDSPDPSPKNTRLTICKEPRKSICTKEYRPVCAIRDTGIRCVTTPCPSTKEITYSNACTACADEKVISYRIGACL